MRCYVVEERVFCPGGVLKDLSADCASCWPLHGVYFFTQLGPLVSVAVCDHEFEPLVEAVPVGANGWTGIALTYHCNEPRKDGPWQIPGLNLVLQQLESAALRPSVENAHILSVVSLLTDAHPRGADVSINYQWGGFDATQE